MGIMSRIFSFWIRIIASVGRSRSWRMILVDLMAKRGEEEGNMLEVEVVGKLFSMYVCEKIKFCVGFLFLCQSY